MGFFCGAFDNSIPSLERTFVCQQRDAIEPAIVYSCATASPPLTVTVPLQRPTSTIPPPWCPRKRQGSPESEVVAKLKDQKRLVQAQLEISMKRCLTLFDIDLTLVYDIVYVQENVLCTTLLKFFLMPTQSQMLQAYTKSVIKKFGHINICVLLAATKIGAQLASIQTVNAILYST